MSAPPTTESGSPPKFEGFAIELVASDRRQDVEARVQAVLGGRPSLQPFGERGIDFEIDDVTERSVADAWQHTYALRAIPGIAYAEPLFELEVSAGPDERDLRRRPAAAPRRGRSVRRARSTGGNAHLPTSNDVDWSLDMTRVFDAWDEFFPGSATPASGIVIGHPDTGFCPHPEIIGAILADQGHDFVDDDSDALDPMPEDPGALIPNPGHGTCTSSVIVSPRGAQGTYQTHDANGRSEVIGVAPGARLIPLRVANSVVLFSVKNLAHAIEYAATAGAHVISISMGGLFSFRLKSAITFAQKRGVIICAAAGNQVRFVVWPAAYDEVIAVAACNADGKIWKGSSRGSKVDVTAPGESVWRAHVVKNGSNRIFDVGRGSGTSYAVATTAGVAALWLAHHGRNALAQRYGLEKIPFIFNTILRESVNRPAGWDTDRFGTGIIDAEKTLAAPLPGPRARAVRAPGPKFDVHPARDQGERATFAHLFEEPLPPSAPATRMRGADGLDAALAGLLRVPLTELPAHLDEVGQELAFHLATDPELYEQFQKAIKQRRPAAAKSATRRGGRGSRAASPSNVRAARARLQASDVSPTLKDQIGG